MNWQQSSCNSSLQPKAANPAAVEQLLYPNSPWLTKWPSLRNITTDLECKPAYCEIADNRWHEGTFLSGMTMGQFPANWQSAWHEIIQNNTVANGD